MMADWKRKDQYGGFTKSAKMRDGEIVSLLLGGTKLSDDEILAQCYPSFVDIDEARDKSIGLVLVASALALLSYFEIVQSFSSSGFEIGSNYLKHISLWAGAISGIYFAMLDSKHMYYKCWFEHRFRNAEPTKRSLLLLLYPRAFDPIKYQETSIGFPQHIHPKRQRIFMPFAILALLAVAFVVLASLALYVALAIDVWKSGSANPLVSKVTVIGAAFVSLLSMFFPKHYDFPRLYQHYGLSSAMANLRERNPERASHFSRIIASVRIRMGLTGEE
jgi:hypothetical protein